MTRWMFRHDEYTKRCSSHAFGDPVEVKTFYDDLIGTGHDLGVSMPVMESYAEGHRPVCDHITDEREDGLTAIQSPPPNL